VEVGAQAKVIVGEGGLFYGRIGEVVRVKRTRGAWPKTYIALRFADGGVGCESALPWWFDPWELAQP
jgi:hypothetical protein